MKQARRQLSPPKIVVITGASAGVGRATARRFARTGASLGLLARDAASLDATRAEMEAAGAARVIALPVDVADADAVFEAADTIESRLGPIDIWINDAMATVFAPVSEMSAREFRRVTEVTYLGFVHGTMAALRHMRPRNRGLILQVGSALAYRGIPLQAAYCGAKHAIRGFTDSLRTELLHDKSAIRLVMVQLPAVNTPQFDWARTRMSREPRPVPPVFQPEVAADAIFNAAQRPSREVWLGMPTIAAILGNTFAPGFLDRYLARQGYGAQERPRSVSADRRDNLFTPVGDLHRTRGSFSNEARGWTPAVSGRAARWGAAALGLGVAAGLGYAVRRLAAPAGRPKLVRRSARPS